MTIRTDYRFGAAHVAVEADDRDASRWLAEFFVPWFESCPAIASAVRVRFAASPAEFEAIDRRYAAATTRPFPCFGLDRDRVLLAGWTEADATIVADTELRSFYRASATGVEVTAQPGFRRARFGLMRVVRELLVAGAQSAHPRLDLHAAAFATPAGAVLLVGPKEAGKTTLLTHFLRCGQASLIANDRVLVDVEPALPMAFGVPTLVSVRPDTLALFSDLRPTPDERPAALHRGEDPALMIVGPPAGSPPRDFSLSPAQFAQRCKSAVTRCGPIAAIVFPCVDTGYEGCALEPLAVDLGSARLLDCRYGIRATPEPRTIFEEMVGSRGPQRDDMTAQAGRLSSAAPLFRCRLGRGAYRSDARELLRALVGACATNDRRR